MAHLIDRSPGVDSRSALFTCRSESAGVLEIEPELGGMLDPAEFAEAARRSVARVVRFGAGAAPLAPAVGAESYGLGLLILDGLVIRRASCGQQFAAELLGPGDLLRPAAPGASPSVAPLARVSWRALTEVQLAVLDRRWTTRMAAWPAVLEALVARAVARAQDILETMAIAQVRGLDDRIWLLLSHFAARYGTVRADGVVLELPLTHELLAELLVARRPSVSTALRRLSRAGHIDYQSKHWRLIRAPSGACGEGGIIEA